MAKDKKADKRLECDWKIASIESKSDELYLEEQKAQQALENFSTIMMSSFKQLQAIDDDINRRSHRQNAYSETQQKQKYISELIFQQPEALKAEYKKERLKLEAEREKLQKERDSLSWE